MSRVTIGILLVIGIALFSHLILADTTTETACEDDLLCTIYYSEEGYCLDGYCNIIDNSTPFEDLFLEENNSNNTLNNTNSTNQSQQNQTNTSNLTSNNNLLFFLQEERLTTLEEQVVDLQNQITQNSDQLAQIENSQIQTTTQLSQVESSVQIVNQQHSELRDNVKGQINSLSTGMAGLQEGLDATKNNLNLVQKELSKEQKITKILTYIFFILLAIAVTLVVLYYLNRKSNSQKEIDPQIIEYISKHIKNGKKYPQIKENLLKAGWSQTDIDWAYKETLKHNYKRYKQTQSPQQEAAFQTNSSSFSSSPTPAAATSFDKRKALFIIFIGLFIIGGGYLIVKGVGTGQAIHFLNEQDFENASFNLLAQNIEDNQFYPLIEAFNGCVEIQDGEKYISFQIQKTPESQLLKKTNFSCSNSQEYDFALKFTSYDAFEQVFNKMTCSSFSSAHEPLDITGERSMYILPSKYVLAGFRLNEQQDYHPFCTALQRCLSQEELATIGINCE